MNYKNSYFLILSLYFVLFHLLSGATYGLYKIDNIGSDTTKSDSSYELEIMVDQGFRDGEYMRIALHYGIGDEKTIFEGKIKRPTDDYHYRLTFKTRLKKNEYDIITVATGRKKKTRAYLGIKVTQGDYRMLQIWKYPTESDILLMLSDTLGLFD